MENHTDQATQSSHKPFRDMLQFPVVAGYIYSLGLIGHTFFLPMYWVIDSMEMTIINAAGILIFIAAFFFNKKGYATVAFTTVLIDIVIHTAASVKFIGWGFGFYYYLPALVPFVFFYKNWPLMLKIVVTTVLFTTHLSLYIYSNSYNPTLMVDASFAEIVYYANIFFVFIGYATVGFLYNNVMSNTEDLMDWVGRMDPLTDLPNRRATMEKVLYEFDRWERSGNLFSILLIDIDDLAKVNKALGNEYGDFTIISIVDMLKALLRKQDVMGRWTGGQFLVLLPETKEDGAMKVAEKLRLTIENNEFILETQKIYMTLTIGVCTFHNHMSPNDCIHYAETALQKGKSSGKNCVFIFN